MIDQKYLIYILLSIKTRIETPRWYVRVIWPVQFISYYPLKQGLKHSDAVPDSDAEYDLYPTIH